MKWINFLHMYQPPSQSKEIVDIVVNECYSRIPKLLDEFPKLKLTINFSGSLLELLEKFGHRNVIDAYITHVQNGRIELVGSAMYHPILPLIPKHEIQKQIALNAHIHNKYFGGYFAPRGFYLPEMAYSNEVGQILKDLGYDWVILDEIHANHDGKLQPNYRYKISGIGLHAIFRDRDVSKTFPPEYILEHRDLFRQEYLITAHDGELYGHWHKDDRGYYAKAFTHPEIEFITASAYLSGLGIEKEVSLRNASWESVLDELTSESPYMLWKSSKNPIHTELWTLSNLALQAVHNNQDDPHINEASLRLSRGLASCAWWWASERKLGPFSPITWNPSEIEKGARELLSAVRTLKKIKKEDRLEAESQFNKIHDMIWKKHWLEYSEQT